MDVGCVGFHKVDLVERAAIDCAGQYYEESKDDGASNEDEGDETEERSCDMVSDSDIERC